MKTKEREEKQYQKTFDHHLLSPFPLQMTRCNAMAQRSHCNLTEMKIRGDYRQVSGLFLRNFHALSELTWVSSRCFSFFFFFLLFSPSKNIYSLLNRGTALVPGCRTSLPTGAPQGRIKCSKQVSLHVLSIIQFDNKESASSSSAYFHCGFREKNISYSALECLSNIFGSCAAEQWSQDHSSRLCWDTTAGLYFLFLERMTGMW